MMKIALIIFLLVHGSLHFMGLAKAYGVDRFESSMRTISKPIGMIWAGVGLLFIAAALMLFLHMEGWPTIALAAGIISQILIFTNWKAAKFGTLANIIIVLVAIVGIGTQQFENSYRKAVLSSMKNMHDLNGLISEKDLEPLPAVVQKYLNYVGVVGKPKIYNVKIAFEGEMRDKGQDWFPFSSEQYNFFDVPTRLFFMKAKVKGVPTYGFHAYSKSGAGMRVKLLALYPVVDIDGPEMVSAETVTYFNDLCLFAPAALIDKRIQWETIDSLSVKATFNTNNVSISAILHFNEVGQLVLFVSNDRLSVSEMKTFPFSTPAKNYKNINGYNLPTYGETIWHYPDGEFVYGKFNLKSIQYNVSDEP